MRQSISGELERDTGTRGRVKKRLRLDAWAFARISLKLTDEEFANYTPAEIAALTRIHRETQQYERALATSCALVSKWSSAENPIPCQPEHLLPLSEEEQERQDELKEKERIAQQHFLAGELRALAKTLPPIAKH